MIIGAASPNASQDKILTGYTARTWQIGEKSINAALLDAARRLSIYVKGVSGEFSTAIRTTPSIFDYVNGTDSSLTLTEQDYAHYITDFEFDLQKDVFIINDVIFVRVHYSKANPVSLSFVPSFTSGRPKWIEKAPEFKGYVTGIGFANPTTDSYAPGVITSYENAVFDIVRQKSTDVTSEVLIKPDGTRISVWTYSKAALKEFYVLGTWIDPKTMAVYTLAVAGE
ncbi:hypothetical protein FACS1894164_02400 [Spirochaetia bacterium]|nr:hypothetical protein FACS1894164_02400 [Spirochaetia bacterium]